VVGVGIGLLWWGAGASSSGGMGSAVMSSGAGAGSVEVGQAQWVGDGGVAGQWAGPSVESAGASPQSGGIVSGLGRGSMGGAAGKIRQRRRMRMARDAREPPRVQTGEMGVAGATCGGWARFL